MDDDSFTTEAKTSAFDAGQPAFSRLLHEMRELSKKKADATLSEFKVGQLNRVLNDMLDVLKDEPEAKYLDTLPSESLPQNSDAVLVMCQFEGALDAFRRRYFRSPDTYASKIWMTEEYLQGFDEEELEAEE